MSVRYNDALNERKKREEELINERNVLLSRLEQSKVGTQVTSGSTVRTVTESVTLSSSQSR